MAQREKYVGEHKDGKRHGQGTYANNDGRIYVGEWKDGVEDGQGRITYPDGSQYVGEFKEGENTEGRRIPIPNGKTIKWRTIEQRRLQHAKAAA
ncbi:MAG: hypothetical protein VX929_08935 [Pseudomonadota bacterium]|nr:hypothetical protein [Pseudomonadota bacterium]